MELEVGRSGLPTLKYNKKYLHSKYDPKRESQQFISGYKRIINNKIIVVYGSGLGYHIKELLEISPSESMIYVFEFNLDIVEYCRIVNNDLFYNSKIKFILGSDINFYRKLSDKMKEVKEIIIHKPSLETIKDKNKRLYQVLEEYIISKSAVEKFADIMTENSVENEKVNALQIKSLIEKFKSKKMRDYIIVSAGPSLDSELERLKYNIESFLILAVGSALKTLIENGINPDAIVIIDPQDIVYNQLQGYEKLNIPLCFLKTASNMAVKKYKGPKYIFDNDDKENSLKTGKTVAISTLDLAVKCDAKNIIMIGQDLACIDGRSHTKTFEDMYNTEDFGSKLKNEEVVKSYDGKLISTTKGYLVFKGQIERLITKNEKVNFFNCSKGVYIEGAKHINFGEYLQRKREVK